jgi:DnaK suppressor protein
LKEVDVTAPKKAASTPKKAAPAVAKGGTATKKAAPKKAAVVKKSAPAAKKATAKKSGPAPKKAPAKKAAPPAKAAAPAPKKAPPPATNFKRTAPAPTPPKRPSTGPYAKEAKFLDEQRALLLEERAVYEGQAVDLRAEADSLALEREPGDVQFDEESGEGGTVTVDRERNLALSAQAGAAVEEIDDALRKIDRKFYGACERCYQPIPKARLRALPFARLCVACKSGGLSRR